MKKQAAKEGGQLLVLRPSEDGQSVGFSERHRGLTGKNVLQAADGVKTDDGESKVAVAENATTTPTSPESSTPERPKEYTDWLAKYKLADTDERFAEWQKKQETKSTQEPAKNAPAAAPQETGATAPAKAAKPAERKEGASAAKQKPASAALFDSPGAGFGAAGVRRGCRPPHELGRDAQGGLDEGPERKADEAHGAAMGAGAHAVVQKVVWRLGAGGRIACGARFRPQR